MVERKLHSLSGYLSEIMSSSNGLRLHEIEKNNKSFKARKKIFI